MRDDVVLWIAHERQETYRRAARDARLAKRVVAQPAPDSPCATDSSMRWRTRSLWSAISDRLARLAGTLAVSRWEQTPCGCGPGPGPGAVF